MGFYSSISKKYFKKPFKVTFKKSAIKNGSSETNCVDDYRFNMTALWIEIEIKINNDHS